MQNFQAILWTLKYFLPINYDVASTIYPLFSQEMWKTLMFSGVYHSTSNKALF